MRRGKVEAAGEPQLDLTPMIDIVFNLLIFFMCATKLRTTEGVLSAWLPRDRGPGVAGGVCDMNEARIRLLRVRADGSVARPGEAGSVVLALGGERLCAPGELDVRPERSPVWGELTRRLRALAAEYRGGRPTGLPVIIDAKPDVPTKHVVAALNEVIRVGLEDVTFAAPELPY